MLIDILNIYFTQMQYWSALIQASIIIVLIIAISSDSKDRDSGGERV